MDRVRAGVRVRPAGVGSGRQLAPPGGERPAAAVVDLQRQVNELRSELLDERWQEANGFVLVFLGFAIGIGELWAYAKFRSIADEASIGAAVARCYMAMPPEPVPRSGLPRGQVGNGSGPLPYLVNARPVLTPAFVPRARRSLRSDVLRAAPPMRTRRPGRVPTPTSCSGTRRRSPTAAR